MRAVGAFVGLAAAAALLLRPLAAACRGPPREPGAAAGDPGGARRRVRVPHNYSLYLEHSSEALRDGFSLSASASARDGAPPWAATSAGGSPHSSAASCDDPDGADSLGAVLAGDGREAGGAPRLRARRATRWSPRPVKQAAGRVAQSRPYRLAGLPEQAVEATPVNSYGPLDCRPEESLDDLGSDERMERIVSLLEVAAATPRRRDSRSTASRGASSSAVTPGPASAPATPNVDTRAQAAAAPNGPPQEDRRIRNTQTAAVNAANGSNVDETAGAEGRGSDSDAGSNWSNEVLLTHAAGERLELYTELANIPLESSTPETSSMAHESDANEQAAHASDGVSGDSE